MNRFTRTFHLYKQDGSWWYATLTVRREVYLSLKWWYYLDTGERISP